MAVTACLPGLTLREAVRITTALTVPTVPVPAAGLAEALADIHRVGLAHRDLKAGQHHADGRGPRLIDFGIARPEDGTAVTKADALLGTPDFMSPEQASRSVAGRRATSSPTVRSWDRRRPGRNRSAGTARQPPYGARCRPKPISAASLGPECPISWGACLLLDPGIGLRSSRS